MLELHLLLPAARELHAQRMRVDELGESLEILNLSRLDELPGTAGQSLDDAVLEVTELGEVDLRFGELDALRLRVTRFVDDLGDVQQRLGRNASAVHAHAARVRFGVDEDDVETEIGGEKRARVSARTTADDDELC